VLIQLRDIHRIYQVGTETVHALEGVSMGIEKGEWVAIMGQSGSGKSTLMNVIGCLDVPTAGTYRLDGTDVADLDDDDLALIRNRRIGFVFQSFNLIPRTTALENVELPLAYARIGRKDRRRRALVALDMVGLSDRLDHLPSELSGGQQQRVAIARALVTAPSLILADEPTGNLDSVSTDDVLDVLDRLNAGGATIVLITHENPVAARTRRVVRLVDGSVVADESREVGDGSRDAADGRWAVDGAADARREVTA